MITDAEVKDNKKIKRVLICNGQFYYDLRAKREELGLEVNDFVMCRMLRL